MRRLFLAATAGLVSACGLLSGLDALEVGEAGASADGAPSTDAPADITTSIGDSATDGGPGVDATALDAGPGDDSGGHVVRCGDNLFCNLPAEHCCATVGSSNPSYKCTSALCAVGELTLNCDDRYDCLDASLLCCFSSTQKVGSVCTTSCSSQNGGTALCVPDAQPTGCGASGTGSCAPFDSGFPVSLGRCN
jgi:hypothetical protein